MPKFHLKTSQILQGDFRIRELNLQGTPSWILFDADSTILAKWFGHKSEMEVASIIHG